MVSRLFDYFEKKMQPIVGVCKVVFLGFVHTFTRGFSPRAMIVYAPPEVMMGCQSSWCRFRDNIIQSGLILFVIPFVLLALTVGILIFFLRGRKKTKPGTSSWRSKPSGGVSK